jgi:hypothetical protein
MTHSLYFKIRFPNEQSLDDFIEDFINDDEFLEVYNLKKNSSYCDGYRAYGDQQPFIYFPDNKLYDPDDEDNKFVINIETGSHVSVDDTMYALQWYYFTIAFLKRFKDELSDVEYWYEEEGTGEELTKDEMLKLIKGTEGHDG